MTLLIVKYFRARVRGFFRKRMLPMSVDEAEEKREFFAKMYFLFGLVSFGYVSFQLYKKRINSTPAENLEEILKSINAGENTRITRFEGFTKVEDYYYGSKKSNKKEENQPLDLEVMEKTNELADAKLL